MRTLTGLAIGDALGMPFEMRKSSDPDLARWDGSFLPCPDTHPFCRGLLPGQWTDDTKMAVQLARSLVSRGKYVPSDAAAHYLEWYRSGDLRGIGTATKKAMVKLDSGTPWELSGTEGAEGNGTAMRVGPLGLAISDLDLLSEMARADAVITHRSFEAEEGSAAVALAVSIAARRPVGTDFRFVAEEVVSWLRPSEVLERVSVAAREGSAMVGAAPFALVKRLEELLLVGKGGHVLITVPAAFFCVAATKTFTEAVELAVHAGGDSDTTGAVTGAIAGTIYGSEGVARYLPELEDAEGLGRLDASLAEVS